MSDSPAGRGNGRSSASGNRSLRCSTSGIHAVACARDTGASLRGGRSSASCARDTRTPLCSVRRDLFWITLALSVWLLGDAATLQAKARLAQVLLDRAWRETRRSGNATKPWPWADTAPMAKLEVPRLGVDEIVLRGDSGRTLAFGPAWNEGSAAPGHGTAIVSGHRDTHFSFLRQLRRDDALSLDTSDGRYLYRVTTTQIVDARTTRLAADASADALVLVTCYPFDAVVAGGPLRYVVRAERVVGDVAVAAR